jgi:hypothetical protein
MEGEPVAFEFDAMRAFGFNSEIVSREQETVGCVTVVTETYQTQTGRSALSTGTMTGLEPTESEGIFRCVPRDARVKSVVVVLNRGAVADLTGNESLRLVLTKKPQASAPQTDDIELMQLNNAGAATMSASPVEISFGTLLWMPAGQNNSFRLIGRSTSLEVLANRLSSTHARTSQYIREERYPALVYTSTSNPVKVLPADISYRISIVYEAVRSPDKTELLVEEP